MRRAARNGLQAASWAAAYSACLVSMWGTAKNFEAIGREMTASVQAYQTDGQGEESQFLQNVEKKKAINEKNREALFWHIGSGILMIASIAGCIKVCRTPKEVTPAAEDATIIPLPDQENPEEIPEREQLAVVLDFRRPSVTESDSSQAS